MGRLSGLPTDAGLLGVEKGALSAAAAVMRKLPQPRYPTNTVHGRLRASQSMRGPSAHLLFMSGTVVDEYAGAYERRRDFHARTLSLKSLGLEVLSFSSGELTNQGDRIDADRLAEFQQLRDVDPSFSGFALRHERLRTPESLGDLGLG
jgi:hypothetical protein